jgi:hypothetical protein
MTSKVTVVAVIDSFFTLVIHHVIWGQYEYLLLFLNHIN